MQLSYRLDRVPAGLADTRPDLGILAVPNENASDELLSRALLMQNLPPPNTKRWVVRRKAAVVAAVRSGGLPIEQALRVLQFSKGEIFFLGPPFLSHRLAGFLTRPPQQNHSS